LVRLEPFALNGPVDLSKVPTPPKRVSHNFTIDFTVTFHPQPTWVGEIT
jgi:hypothetical protein